MADFFIYVNDENFLAIVGDPDDLADDATQVVAIPDASAGHTVFRLRNGDQITLDLSLVKINEKLNASGQAVKVSGKRHA